MSRDPGFGYTVALTDAIRTSTNAVARVNPEAFAYGKADLRSAVERALYIGLASDPRLIAAYAGGGQAPPLGSWMADATAATLLGRATASAPLHPRVIAARGLFAARAAGDRRRERESPSAAAGGDVTCFVIDHPKYLRFIAPMQARMESRSVVAATHPGEGVAERVDVGGAGPPARRAVGRALWGFPSLLHLFDRVLEVLRRRGASRTVVIEGMSPLDELASQASKALGIPSICVQQGWSPLIHAGFRGLTHTRMAVWGDGFRELLAPHNPGVEFAVTGNPALGAELSTGRLEAEIGRRPAVAFFLQSTSSWIGQEHLRALHELVSRTAARLPGAAVLVREHPGAPLEREQRERMSAAPNVRLVPAAEWPLREVLDAADVTVSIYSTSLLEGAALGTPAVIFNPTSLPPLEPDLVALGAGARADTVEGAVEEIARIVEDRDHRERLRAGTNGVRDRYFAGADAQRAAERVAAVIDGDRP